MFPLPPVEVFIPRRLPQPGARTAQVKVLDETRTPHSLTLDLEAMAGSSLAIELRCNGWKGVIHATGAELGSPPAAIGLQSATVKFPSGSGYERKTVSFTW